MMTMKRCLPFLLAACIIFSLAGCGGDGNTASLNAESLVSPDISSSEEMSFEESTGQTSSEPTSSGQASSGKTGGSVSSAGKNTSTSGQKNSPSSPGSSSSSVSSQALQTVKVTFTEGMTLPKMFGILEDKKIAKEDALFTAAASGDFSSYSLVNGIQMSSKRCYRLEGYLFPDTYEFYVGESPESILKKMLDNTQKRIPQSYKDRASAIGMSMDDVIILASLIEKEAGAALEMGKVSSVLHNRLDDGMKLQCDSTITYVEYVIKPFITGDINRYNSYYNTYKCAALPAGPICNPGKAAMEAALWPETTSYYYFAMDSAGNHYYAETYEEHVANCQKAGIGVHAEN